LTSTDRPVPRRRLSAGRTHDLGRMGLKELVPAFVTYPTVQIYAVLTLAAAAGSAWTGAAGRPIGVALAILAAFLVYPLVWYVLHRFILHSRFLYRFPATAKLWKRIHFDHHQDPHRLDVLFGSLTNTLPTIAIATLPIGYLLAGWPGALAALASGLGTTLVYEFCHCIQHLNFLPNNAWLKKIKALHMAHHFHNEQGNYGIISFWPDRLFKTQYALTEVPRSPTVHNLGYDAAEAERFPWVATLAAEAKARAKARALED
jgi:sterol desaturase/sphingolipid hydroxylase (fatty acid hydroxylase superfamily)